MTATDTSVVNIVSGLPRSGTSMMMRMIAEGGIPALIDNLRKPDDDNPLGYYEFEPVKKTKQDPSWIDTAGGKVVKMVHVLLLDLPLDRQYRVVFMRRHMDEVLASQDVMLQRNQKAGGNLPPEKLKQIFLQQIRKVEDHLHNNAKTFQLLEIDYNSILKDPAPHVKQLNAFLGGSLDTEKMMAVVDPKLYRQRKG